MKNIFLMSALVLVSKSAFAQIQLPTCIDHTTGQQVPINTLTDIQSPAAFAILDALHHPEIFVNESVLPEFESSPATITFIVMHECGDVNLGYLTLGSVSEQRALQDEIAADCWAAHTVHAMGFTTQQMQQVITDIDKLPKDLDHPKGMVRGQNIKTCFN